MIACLGIIITTRYSSYPRTWAYITHVIFETRPPLLCSCALKRSGRWMSVNYHTRSMHSGCLTMNTGQCERGHGMYRGQRRHSFTQASLVNQTTPFNSVMGKGVDWFTRIPTRMEKFTCEPHPLITARERVAYSELCQLQDSGAINHIVCLCDASKNCVLKAQIRNVCVCVLASSPGSLIFSTLHEKRGGAWYAKSRA